MGLLNRAKKSNRKLRQRRPLRARLPDPGLVWAAALGGLRRGAPVFLALGGVAVLAAGVFAGHRFLHRSSRFAVRQVVVSGAAHLSREELLAEAGIGPGVNLFSVSLDGVERTLLKDPWIERAEVRRRLPDTITVTVVERQAAAVLLVDGRMYLTDAAGRPFKRASVEESDGLVVVSGLDRDAWRRLAHAEADAGPALVRRALAVAQVWQATSDRPRIGEAHLGREGITLYTHDGAVAIKLARPADPAELGPTLQRFDAAWGALSPDERSAARTVHLDSRARPDRVAITLRTQ